MYTPSTLAKGLERDVAATGYCPGSPGPSRVSQWRELLRRTRLDFGASDVLSLQVLITLHQLCWLVWTFRARRVLPEPSATRAEGLGPQTGKEEPS